MPETSVPITDHVARHCKKRWIFDDGAVASSAFELRRDPSSGALDEDYVSVGWLERYVTGGQIEAQIARMREILNGRILTLKKKDGFAVLNVGRTIQTVRDNSQRGRVIRILHDPITEPGKEDDGHSGIHDTADDEKAITELIASTVLRVYPALLSLV